MAYSEFVSKFLQAIKTASLQSRLTNHWSVEDEFGSAVNVPRLPVLLTFRQLRVLRMCVCVCVVCVYVCGVCFCVCVWCVCRECVFVCMCVCERERDVLTVQDSVTYVLRAYGAEVRFWPLQTAARDQHRTVKHIIDRQVRSSLLTTHRNQVSCYHNNTPIINGSGTACEDTQTYVFILLPHSRNTRHSYLVTHAC